MKLMKPNPVMNFSPKPFAMSQTLLGNAFNKALTHIDLLLY